MLKFISRKTEINILNGCRRAYHRRCDT